LSISNLANCKGKSEPEGKSNVSETIKSSKSALKVANEFVKAGMNGDFNKLFKLCCKDNGPYTTFRDVRYLDLGDLGFIEKIIREEKSEADPDSLKLAVARTTVLGKIGFYCFYVFKTPAGYRVYLKKDYLWKYPPEKLPLSKIALNFYFSNRFNLKKAIVLAEYILSSNPSDLKTHSILASIYGLIDQKQKMIEEIKKIIIKDPNSKYALSFKSDLLFEACEGFLKDEIFIKRSNAVKLLLKVNDERTIPVLEIAFHDQNVAIRAQALNALDKLRSEKTIPLLDRAIKDNMDTIRLLAVEALGRLKTERTIPPLERALQDNSKKIKERTARILTNMGNDKGKSALINILSDKVNKIIKIEYEKVSKNKAMRAEFRESVRELGNLRDVRAVPTLLEAHMSWDPTGFLCVYTYDALSKIGKPAIPYLEEIVSKESEIKKRWQEEGRTRHQIAFKFDGDVCGIKGILKRIKKW